MLLQTDEQTIEDLRIFSKRGQAGIYDLYNSTSTKGGEMILERMFRQPMGDRAMINHRAGLIAQFAKQGSVFPFAGAILDTVEKYMVPANDQNEQAVHQTIMNEKEISAGVSAIIELLHRLKSFIADAGIHAIGNYTGERLQIESLLSDPAFVPVFKEQGKGKLSYGAVTAYDVLLRVRERTKIEALLQFIYHLDVYISVAKVAVERGFIFPVAMDKGSGRLKLEDVYHPELPNPVSNSITMDAAKNVVFLTGANMAGKSTFLRSLSTAVYIAHMGFPVAARSMEFSVMDGVYTTINLPDNLGIGASHFYAEVLRVKKVAAELGAGKSLFVIFDELFRGTNVKDAHEATIGITHAFAGKKSSLFIISSHIVEAGDALRQKANIGFHFLPTRMKGNTPEYTYKLEEGITSDRHGMIIIRNEGVLEILKNGKKN